VKWVATRLFDLRQGEWSLAARAFATLLLLIAAHTTLETARDAIFLARLPARDLNFVYVALAGLTLLTTAISIRLAIRFGRRNALICTLAVAAYACMLLYFTTQTRWTALALYVFSGLEGSLLTLQFWLLASQLFTVAQGRRLFGPIGAGGVLGSALGAAGAAMWLRFVPVTALLPVTAALFLGGALLLTTFENEDDGEPSMVAAPTADVHLSTLFRDHPLVGRIAGIVALGTSAVLVVDFLFKSTVARHVAPAALGPFFARYYAVTNAVSLLVQVLVAGPVIRRLGVAGAAAILPVLLLGGSATALLGGGVFAVVLALKAVDGGLRYSLNRVAIELLFLPLPSPLRERAKGFIDSVLSRAVQALTAVGLYALASRGHMRASGWALIIVVLCGGWTALTLGLQRSYLDLFRRMLAGGRLRPDDSIAELDVRSAEALVESMASQDPRTVIAAMVVLEQHEHVRLIPALILYHDDEAVLSHALRLFAQSERTDWIPLATRLLSHDSERVRVAAVGALARKGQSQALESAREDPSPLVHAYYAFCMARREASGEDLVRHPLVSSLLASSGAQGAERLRGLLAAACDTPDDATIDLLVTLARHPQIANDEDAVIQLASAIRALPSPRFIETCIARLAVRAGREAMVDALVAIGDPAFEALDQALLDQHGERRVRMHVPHALAGFGSQRVADTLQEALFRERDGLVRYKLLRALGRLVAARDVKIDRIRIENEAGRNLEEYLRLVALSLALGTDLGAARDGTAILLADLLSEKRRQSLERTFRLLKIAHKREDIRAVHLATSSPDRRVRASAGEFLDALLVKRDQQSLRTLLRLVVDDATDAERVSRAVSSGRAFPQTRDQALSVLVDDPDESLAALATHCALAMGDEALRASVLRAGQRRPALRAMNERFFGAAVPVEIANG
jgi:AAA family ATP:ADP antiporter